MLLVKYVIIGLYFTKWSFFGEIQVPLFYFSTNSVISDDELVLRQARGVRRDRHPAAAVPAVRALHPPRLAVQGRLGRAVGVRARDRRLGHL
tara:strand:+ start:24095 stop:24370 length:276 start_codon:yes stop_codon:yes gene_type:complete